MFRRSGGFRSGGFRGSRGPRRESFDLPKPVEVGKEYDVEISEVGSKGDGIARKDNFVIFVPNTKQGEKVKVRISTVGRSFAVGEKVSAEAAAAEPAEAVTEAEPAEELEETGETAEGESPGEAESTESEGKGTEEEN